MPIEDNSASVRGYSSPDRRGHVCEECRDVPKSSRTLNLPNFPSSRRTFPPVFDGMRDTERITLSMQRAAAAVPRSSAECLQRDFWEWRLRPSETRLAAMADDLR